MELSPAELFDGFPEPVLLVRDAAVCYHNRAAERLFPELKYNHALTGELLTLAGDLSGPAVLLVRAAGADWRMSVQETGAGFLVLFRGVEEGMAPYRADRLALHLRQQTAGLNAALQRLAPGQDVSEERQKKYLALANQGLYRLLRLVDHIEFLDRAERDIYRPETLDLAGLCRSVGDELEDLCNSAGYTFIYESDVASLLTVGDMVLIRRMLFALLSNAMKAAGEGGHFGMKLARQGNRAVITVWDGGLGVGPERMGLLFGGESARAPGLDPDEGLGLGLSTVRKAAALHGGTIMMESRDGEGLRAVVSLPIREVEHSMPLRAPEQPYEGGAFSPLLMEFSDLLPAKIFAPEHLE